MLFKKKIVALILNNIIDDSEIRKLDTNAFKIKSRRRRRRILLRRKVINRKPIQKIVDFMRTVSKYRDETFVSHFRLNREQFQTLSRELEPLYRRGKRRPKVPLGKALLLTLWALASQDSFRAIADRFNTSRGCANYTFINVCKIICKLAPKYIRWPQSEAELQEVSAKFNTLRSCESFPNVIGCVDSTHIEITAPKDDKISYYNRKGYYSLILQGTCDSEYRFTNVFFGWPGSAHDARVWDNSQLGQRLKNNEMTIPEKYRLLGDMAYPLCSYLMTPYKDDGTLNRRKSNFNSKLSSTRIIIEQAFSLLKGRFRRLKFLEISNLKYAKYSVISAVILHNLIIDSKIELNAFSSDEESSSEDENTYETYLLSAGQNLPETNKTGKQKRDFLSTILM